ncbi:MAG: PrpF family protein [Rhizobiaceae bacterium]|nr:PrpF family protein [Rhizobiaceae bacterium]
MRDYKPSGEQKPYKIVLMRGGSSKAVFLNADDLPEDKGELERLILALFGSPDIRQIDGIGGADYLTSKCAIIGRPSRPDADIDYTFAQVSIVSPVVSFDVNCGNISSAAAVYAIEEGYVQAGDGLTTVRVHNTNTAKILTIRVPTVGGLPAVEGDFEMAGVPGKGAEISIDFSDTAGACTGKLLPTGRVVDTVDIRGSALSVSIVDVGNPCVFIRAEDLRLKGTEVAGEYAQATLDLLEEIRVESAKLINIQSHVLPLQVLVSSPQSYQSIVAGRTVGDSEIDIVARQFLEKMLHKAYAGTAATCLAVAAKVEGTLVHSASRKSASRSFRIGHPSGVLPIKVAVRNDGDEWQVKEALYSRTARRLLTGVAYVRTALLAQA